MSGENRIAERVDAVGNCANGVAAHYEYAPFGEVTAQVRRGGVTAYDFSAINPWRFSSEYADEVSGTVYYNYRHYEPMMGRWLSRDVVEEKGGINLYSYCTNNILSNYDTLGLYVDIVYCIAEKTLTVRDVDSGESIALKERVVSGNGESCCRTEDQWKINEGPLPTGKYLVGLSYVPKQHEGDSGDYNWYRLYGSNGEGGYSYDRIPVKAPDGTTVYRGGFNLHTGRESDGCVTVWSDLNQGDKGYPQSDDYDKLKKILDKTKPLKYKNSNYAGWMEVM